MKNMIADTMASVPRALANLPTKKREIGTGKRLPLAVVGSAAPRHRLAMSLHPFHSFGSPDRGRFRAVRADEAVQSLANDVLEQDPAFDVGFVTRAILANCTNNRGENRYDRAAFLDQDLLSLLVERDALRRIIWRPRRRGACRSRPGSNGRVVFRIAPQASGSEETGWRVYQ